MSLSLPSAKGVHFVFTENNPSGLIDLESLNKSCDNLITYCVYQEECGENGTYHFQGYLETAQQTRISRLRRLLPKAHFEVSHSPNAAEKYAQKTDTQIGGPHFFGTRKKTRQGKRSDLSGITDLVLAGASLRSISLQYPSQFLRYHNGIRAFQRLHNMPQLRRVQCIVLFGPPGGGKSPWVSRMYPGACWISDTSPVWYDGLDDHTVLVIDDFEGNIPYREFLSLSEGYPQLLRTKGGFVVPRFTTIVITTNVHPRHWYNYDDQKKHYAAIEKRITIFHVFGTLKRIRPFFRSYIADFPLYCL